MPDLATSLQDPTDGGKTYTFQLRFGIRYSNGELVEAADFRRAIETGFALNLDAHDLLFKRLVGGKACVNEIGTCDLSRGIVTDDATGTITFHLVAPDPEFLFKLALPFAYPVPAAVPDEEQVRTGAPGTGPYMLEAPWTSEGLTLVRNPNFHVWSPEAQPSGNVHWIEWTFGVSYQAQVDAVAAGDADVALEAYASGRLDEIFVRFAEQVHSSPQAETDYVVLNNAVAPFNDVRVRRALNFALDRNRVVQIFGGEKVVSPTCQQLPPNFPRVCALLPIHERPSIRDLERGELERAQRLVRRSGTPGCRSRLSTSPAPDGETSRTTSSRCLTVSDTTRAEEQ